MTQWVIPIIILIAAIWFVPMSVRSMKQQRKGRLGTVMLDVATAIDPARTLIVQEAEKRQNQDGEEVSGEDEPQPEEAASR